MGFVGKHVRGYDPVDGDDFFDGTAARKAVQAEPTCDFAAEMEAVVTRVASLLPPGASEWAFAERPDLMEAVDRASNAADIAASAGDVEAFRAALEEYEAAWRAVFSAYEREKGAAAGGDNGGDVEELSDLEDVHSSRKEPTSNGIDTDAGDIDTAMDNITTKATGNGEGGSIIPQANLAEEPARIKALGGTSPVVTPAQLSIFPEVKDVPSERAAVPPLPFGPEPAPTAWRDWLDRVEVVAVRDLSRWKDAVAAARAAGVCGFDTETTGLDPFINEIRLVQLAIPIYPSGKANLVAEDGLGPELGSGAVAYVADLWGFGPEERRRILESVAALAADPGVSFAGCNLKFDLKFLRAELAAAGGKPRWPGKRFPCERLFDVMLASQLVTAGDFVPEAQFPKWCEVNGIHVVKEGNGLTRYFDRHGHEIKFERDTQKKIRPIYPTHSLKEIAHRHLEVVMDKEEQTSNWSAPELTERQLRYAGLDAAVLLPLREILEKLLRKNRLARAAKIEFDALAATVEIEACGMPFDPKGAWELEERVRGSVEAARSGLVGEARAAGFRARPKKSEGKRYSPDLNPDSPIDVIDCLEILAGREGVLVDKKNGTKGFLLPDGEVLPLASRDEVISRVAVALPDGSTLRRFILLLQEYRKQKKKCDFLKKWIELTHPLTGRLHPDLRQLNPQGVGRYSASNPNVQQAGRDKELRSLFRVDGGRTLILADYSSIEMRVACEISGDRELLRAFNEGVDVHKFTASYLSGKPMEEVTKAERQAAKACFSGDTEILTPYGWVKFEDYDGATPVAQYVLPDGLVYNPPRLRSNRWGLPTGKVRWDGSGGKIEFVIPLAFEKFDGREVLRQVDRNTDLVLTPDHEVIFIDTNARPRKMAVDKVKPGSVKYVVAAGDYKIVPELPEIHTRILAMVVADGSFSGRLIRFGFTKRRKIERCLALLKEGGVEFTLKRWQNGVTSITIMDRGFCSLLLRYVNKNKELLWDCIHEVDGRIYLDEARYWDGYSLKKSGKQRILFSTTKRQTAEVMQAMAALNGVPSVMTIKEARKGTHSTEYHLSYVLDKPPVWRVSWHPEPLWEKRTVFCVQVPSGAILVRRNGKVSAQGNCNFGLLYGMSPKTLKEYAELGYGVRMSLREAEEAREKFFRLYSGVAAWHERGRHAVHEGRFGEFHRHDGVRGYYTERRPYVRMPGGHMRVWPVVEEDGGGRKYLRKAGPLTEVYNSPVQGGAAELLKVAMARLYRELLARRWDDVFMTLTLHDELHLEASEDKAEEVVEVLRGAMVGAAVDLGFSVPVEVECVAGDSWAAKE
ncbi:MAG: DNA polymerase [Moorellaceae bacterium]